MVGIRGMRVREWWCLFLCSLKSEAVSGVVVNDVVVNVH